MQISAANLLLAAQQSQRAKPARADAAAFSDLMAGKVAAQKTARFSPPDFAADEAPNTTAEPAPAAPVKAAAGPAGGYAAAAPPGSTLDIRI